MEGPSGSTVMSSVGSDDLLAAGLDAAQVEMMSERVILVDEHDQRIGSASKSASHHLEGALHRAFSVLIFDTRGRMLMQKRAAEKITFPGVWANACCSHPLDVEDESNGFAGSINAVIRKMEQELGVEAGAVDAGDLQAMTRMLYMSRMNEQWVEKELDHIFILQKELEYAPNPKEIDELRWFSADEWRVFSAACPENGEVIAPWFQLIADNLLADWWANLDTLHGDDRIHRFGRHDLLGVAGMNEGLGDAISRCRPAVEEKIMTALSLTQVERLRKAMTHLFKGGGKRLRATLPRLVGEALGNAHEGHDDVGAALEVIHNFTLVHDDIMDDDDIRRGGPAVHIAYDQATAINAGDAMLAVGFEILAGSSAIAVDVLGDVVLAISRMVRQVSEGQQLDIAFENEEAVGSDEYLQMIEGKTAMMFQTAAHLGALLSGASSKVIQSARSWGREVGMCFQLIDDLLDVVSDDETLGKPHGSDIRQGKKTLMVLHALEQQGALADTLAGILAKGESASEQQVATAISALDELGSMTFARNIAEQHHKAAHEALSEFPLESDLSILRQLTDYQLTRLS